MVVMDGKFHENQKIKLRADVDTSIYGDYACAGNEGWVLRYRKDKFDLPEILVHWDQNHWTYNGVQDGWTFEDHFEPVEDMPQEPDKEQQINTLLQSFGDGLKSILGKSEGSERSIAPDKPKPESTGSLRNLLNSLEDDDQTTDADMQYEQALEEATQELEKADGFIVVGVSRQDHVKAEKGMLVPFALGFSKTMETELLLGAHLSHVAAREHQGLTIQAITALASSEE